MEFAQKNIVILYLKTIRQLSYLPNTYQPVVWLCLAKLKIRWKVDMSNL